MKKQVAIVHFNTPKLTTAAVMSLRKQGYDGRVVIFENSRSWVTKEGEEVKAEPYPIDKAKSTKKKIVGVGDVEIIDNTKGQLVDFDAELAKWKKDKDQGYSKGCNFGSVKHMLSVEWLMQNMEEPFVLMDSDILLKAPIDDMFDDRYTAIGATDSGMNVYGISRLIPFLCYINAPECRRMGLHYFDPDRAWAIIGGKVLYGKHYDTGASFNEDLKLCKQAKVKHIDITKKMIHMGSGSWLQKHKADEWLTANGWLWKDAPTKVALCGIGRQENRYICEWLDYYQSIGVAKVYLYDNYHGDEERLADVVQPYVESGFVELIDVGNRNRAQCRAYEECYAKHRGEYGWMLFFDIDEFLRFDGKNIEDFLKRYKTGDVLMVNWRTMTDTGLVHYDPRPVQERFTGIMPNDVCIKYPWPENLHIKCMVRGGLGNIKFGNNPHNPVSPTLACIDVHGEPTPQKAFSEKIIHDTMWLDHYWTKTAEEWVNVKLSRGYHGDQHYTNMIRSQSDRNFFGVNERTPEKEMILSALLFQNPKTQKIMEHIAKTPQGNDQYRLEAETGYLLKSKLSGKTYKAIDTRDLKRWEVIEDPDYVKPESKPAADATGTVAGKPQTQKRKSSKSKK